MRPLGPADLRMIIDWAAAARYEIGPFEDAERALLHELTTEFANHLHTWVTDPRYERQPVGEVRMTCTTCGDHKSSW
jgi:hypothetical protein